MAEENGMSRRVVQRLREGETDGTWEDVGAVDVPARTKRRTIIEKVLSGLPRQEGTYRVLDEESARSITVVLEQQPPRMIIG
jgi:hypothetical protein